MAAANTSSGGASISMVARTSLMGSALPASASRVTVPASASVRSHTPSACSTAASKECMRTPKNPGADSSRGSRSDSRLSMSGSMSPTSSPAIAAATFAAIGVIVSGMRIAGRPSSRWSRIASTISP